MTVEDISVGKKQLESDLTGFIREFETFYGITVSDMFFSRIDTSMFNEKSSLVRVEVVVEIP